MDGYMEWLDESATPMDSDEATAFYNPPQADEILPGWADDQEHSLRRLCD